MTAVYVTYVRHAGTVLFLFEKIALSNTFWMLVLTKIKYDKTMPAWRTYAAYNIVNYT